MKLRRDSSMRWLASGIAHLKLSSHPGAQKVGDQRSCDGKPDECAPFAADDCGGDIAEQVHEQKPHGQALSPPDANPQAPRREGARHGNGEHEGDGPGARTDEGGVRLRVKSPHPLQGNARNEEGETRETSQESPEGEEDTEGDESWSWSIHPDSG